MCGIFGVVRYDGGQLPSDAVIIRARDTMRHRGPDGAGLWRSPDGRAVLAHRRLSIIDLSAAAAQPMSNEDGSVWVTYNGEIYNHVALRAELARARVTASAPTTRTPRCWCTATSSGARTGLAQRIAGDYGFGSVGWHSVAPLRWCAIVSA